jgi:hypothetical protein
MDVRALDLAERDAVGIRRQSEEVGETVDCISPSNSQSPSIAKDGHSVSLSANFGNCIQLSYLGIGKCLFVRFRMLPATFVLTKV